MVVAYIHIYIHMYIHVYIHMHMHIHIQIYIYAYIYMYIHAYTHVFTGNVCIDTNVQYACQEIQRPGAGQSDLPGWRRSPRGLLQCARAQCRQGQGLRASCSIYLICVSNSVKFMVLAAATGVCDFRVWGARNLQGLSNSLRSISGNYGFGEQQLHMSLWVRGSWDLRACRLEKR